MFSLTTEDSVAVEGALLVEGPSSIIAPPLMFAVVSQVFIIVSNTVLSPQRFGSNASIKALMLRFPIPGGRMKSSVG